MLGAHANSLLKCCRPAVVVAATLTLLGAAGERPLWSGSGAAGPAVVDTTACRTDHPVVVTARGNLESERQTTIRCQVESRDRFSNGTAILFIIPDGNRVAEGDVLVEFDSATIRDVLDAEALEWQSAKSELAQAEARFKNQRTLNETRVAEAELALELAELNLLIYTDEENGTFKLELGAIDRRIDDTRKALLAAQGALKLKETEKTGIEKLFKLGYKGKSDLEQVRFSFQEAESALSAVVNRLTIYEATRSQMTTYRKREQLLRMQGRVDTANRNLRQAEVTNESKLAEMRAELFEAQEREKHQSARVGHYEQQLRNCTIRSPHAGTVAYAQPNSHKSNDCRICEGAQVRQRQQLLCLRDL